MKELSEFPAFAKTPTQKADNGICYDFNYGARVLIPAAVKNVQVTIIDDATGTIHLKETLDDADHEDVLFLTKIKYFIRWRIIVNNLFSGRILLDHTLNLKDELVAVQMPIGALGDTIAWFKWIPYFANIHKCFTNVCINPNVHELFAVDFIKMPFVSEEDMQTIHTIHFLNKDESSYKAKEYYATYRIGMFYGTKEKDDYNNQPIDYRICGLSNIAAHILGIPLDDIKKHQDDKPIFDKDALDNKNALLANLGIKRPYIVIATKTTCYVKHWLNPYGWNDVIEHFKNKGYDIVCIDRDTVTVGTEKENPSHFAAFTTPPNCINDVGNKPLMERLSVIYYADAFVGLSSGLSWLAWLTDTPVVMISNFTAPHNEFYTPYRIMNLGVCNSCWNDGKEKFINSDFFYCPRHRNDKKAWECQRMITSKLVIDTIEKALKIKGTQE